MNINRLLIVVLAFCLLSFNVKLSSLRGSELQYTCGDSILILNLYNPGTCFHCYAIYTHLPRIYEQNPQLKVVYLFPKVRPFRQKEISDKMKFGADYDAEFIFDSEYYRTVTRKYHAAEGQNFLLKISAGGQDTSILFIDHLDKSLSKRKDVVAFLLN